MIRTVAVLGGSGWLGSAVSRVAVANNINVLAVSRSAGLPNARWAKHVQWVKANALSHDELIPILHQCDAVVHSIGTLFEDTSYKRLKSNAIPSDYAGSRTTYEEMNRGTHP